MNKLLKKVVAGVAALTMCVSAMPLSANAEGYSTGTTTSIQQVSNDVYNQVLELGFDEDEAQYIVDNVDEDEILSILGSQSNPNSRATNPIHYLKDETYHNVAGWNTDNSCSSVAAAIFLVYYSCNHYPEISYSSPYNLYKALKPYIELEYKTRSAYLSDIKSGLKEYLNDHENSDIAAMVRSLEYYSTDSTTTANFKKMCLLTIARINRDEPVMSVGYYPNAGIHTIVVEGIQIGYDSSGELDTSNTYIYVNYGWGGTKKKLNFYDFVRNSSIGSIIYLF